MRWIGSCEPWKSEIERGDIVNRLRHDVAWVASIHIMAVFEDLVREDEHKDAMNEIYSRVKAALVSYDTHRQRMEKRVNRWGIRGCGTVTPDSMQVRA
jgi:hypothetical protein